MTKMVGGNYKGAKKRINGFLERCKNLTSLRRVIEKGKSDDALINRERNIKGEREKIQREIYECTKLKEEIEDVLSCCLQPQHLKEMTGKREKWENYANELRQASADLQDRIDNNKRYRDKLDS